MSHAVGQPRPALSVVSGRAYSKKEDAELVLLCQRKDQAALEELVRRHQRTVFSLLYNLAPDWSDIADLAQEVFIRVWKGIDRLQNPRSFRSWLGQIVTNLFYDELRKAHRHTRFISLDQSTDVDDENDVTRDIPDHGPGPDEVVHRQEMAEAVRTAMAGLPPQFRSTIVLREIEGLTYEEIANITGADMGTVKSRMARARLKVQKQLKLHLGADCCPRPKSA